MANAQQSAVPRTPALALPVESTDRKSATSTLRSKQPSRSGVVARAARSAASAAGAKAMFSPAWIPAAMSVARGAYSMYRDYRRESRRTPVKGRIPERTAPFGMNTKADRRGSRVVRTYRMELNVQNLASAQTSQGYSLNISNTAGVYNMTTYAGTAISGTGTSLSSDITFPAEATAFMDLFKWFKVNKIQYMFIPVIQANVQSANATLADQSVLSDAGAVYITEWNGDNAYVNATGTGLLDPNSFRRMPYHSFNPRGDKMFTIALRPKQEVRDDSIDGSDTAYYQDAKAIDTTLLQTAGSIFPFYGLRYLWYHPNMVSDAGHTFFRVTILVECQWNTVKDDDNTAPAALGKAGKEELYRRYSEAKQLAGQPQPSWDPNGTQPQHPLPTPEIDPALEERYQEEKKQSDLAARERADIAKKWRDQQTSVDDEYVAVPQPAAPVVKQGLPVSRPATPTRLSTR